MNKFNTSLVLLLILMSSIAYRTHTRSLMSVAVTSRKHSTTTTTTSTSTSKRYSDSNDGKHINNAMYDISHHKMSIAPMMDYTDCHQRKLQRLITKHAVLYTEMVVANALIRTDNQWRFLEADFNIEDPLVLQLGGADPTHMRDAAKIAHSVGYKEININVGCPSEKVAGAGCFGASLMLRPLLVADLAYQVSVSTNRPTTIKCRIGVDDYDSYELLKNFISIVSEKGYVRHFIIHARKALLGAKFSPHDNRTIPPLKYDVVYQLVKDFPHLDFTINGGITTIEDAMHQLDKGCKGVMIGRSAINTPWYWRNIDTHIYNSSTSTGLNRKQILDKYCQYAQSVEDKHGAKVRRALMKPVFNLFHGEHNGKLFRCLLDDYIKDSNCCISEVIIKAGACITDEVLEKI